MPNRILFLWGLCLAVACGSDPARLLVDDTPELEERLDARSQRMAVTFIRPDGQEAEVDASALIQSLTETCGENSYLTEGWSNLSADISIDASCREGLIDAVFARDCAAYRLVELAQSESPLEVSVIVGVDPASSAFIFETVTFHPQLPEARIALLREAANVAQQAVLAAGDTIRFHAGQAASSTPALDAVAARVVACDGKDGLNPTEAQLNVNPMRASLIVAPGANRDDDPSDDTVTPLSMVAELMVGASSTMERAARLEVQRQVSIAEAERSRSTSPAVASRLAWMDPLMSRSSAAKHLLGGAAEGLYGFNENKGVCPVASPTGEVAQAIQAIRSSGVEPAYLFDLDVAIDDLLVGGGTVASGESIGERLTQMAGDGSSFDSTESVLRYADVSMDALAEARLYMTEEARAFAIQPIAVSGGLTLSPELVGGVPTDRSLAVSAATLRAPIAPPGMYYLGAAQLADVASFANDGTGYHNRADAAYGGRSVAHTLDYATSVATDFGGFEGPSAEYAELPEDVKRRLRPLLEAAPVRAPARVQFCRQAKDIRAEVAVRSPDFMSGPSDLLVVRGVSGLRCAVEGQVQGEDCDLADYTLGTGSYTQSSTSRTSGIRTVYGVEFTVTEADLSSEGPELAFIYALRQMGDESAPGRFEALGSFRLDIPEEGCMMTPVIPELTELTENILTPSTAYCSTAKESCAGPAFAARIPLENELSGDDGGQGLENSWQYWIGLAEESATLSDRLGEELLLSGESIDEGLEMVEDRLGELCGAPVDIADAFFELLDQPPGGACPCGGTDSGYTCVDSNCVRDIEDLLSEERFRPLRECLGSDSVIDHVAAGSRPLCAWELNGQLCGVPETPAGMTPVLYPTCPWGAGGTSEMPTCTSPSTLPPGAAMLQDPISETLGIFESDDGPGADPDPAPEGPFDCSIIRTMRNTESLPLRRTYATQVAGSEHFRRDALSRLVNRIGYRAEPDDYGHITLDGKRWRSLGSPRDPGGAEVSEWPCNRDMEVGGCGDPASTAEDASLFCASAAGHCGAVYGPERASRAFINHRMARAVMALKVLTGRDAANVVLPFRPEPHPLANEADPNDVSGHADLKGWRWVIQSDNDSFQLRDGRDFAFGSGVEFGITEYDGGAGGGDDHATLTVEGTAGCVAGAGSPYLWTHFLSRSLSSSRPVMVPCNQNDVFMTHDGTHTTPAGYWSGALSQAVVFRGAAGTREADIGVFETLWDGMGEGAVFQAPENGELGSLTAVLAGTWYGTLAEAPDCGWHGDQWRCERGDARSDATALTSYWMSGNNESNRYNDLRLFDDGIQADDFLDGLELACEVMADDFRNPSVFEPSVCGDWDALASGSLSNLRQAQRLMQCMAHEIERRGERQVFSDLPEAALEAIRGTATIPGARGEQLAILATELNRLASYPSRVAHELNQAGLLLNRARIANSRNETRQELNEVERRSTQTRESLACVASLARAAAQNMNGVGSLFVAGANYAAAAADCANSVAQVVFAKQRANLQNRLSELDEQSEINLITSQLASAMEGLKQLSTEMQNAQIAIRGALARLESQRESALREVTEALTIYGNTSAVSTVRRRRFNTLQVRYEEAQQRAIGTAWLARRALEQRLGRDMANMVDDMPLVAAPSEWADELCVMTGVDYRQVSRDYELPAGDNYAREYVGDYIRRLRAVFDSYSVAHPFVTGDDTAVISLRDDVVNARQWCDGPARNLLAYSGVLNVTTDPDYVAPPAVPDGTVLNRNGPPVWEHVGCVPYTVNITDSDGNPATAERTGGCIGMEQTTVPRPLPGASPSSTDVVDGSPEFGAPSAWVVRFGGESELHPGQSSYPATGAAVIAQRVTLARGTYRLSWRGGAGDVDPRTAVEVHGDSGALSVVRMDTAYEDEGGWPLYYLFFSLASAGEVDVVITGASAMPSAASSKTLQIAALMLENVTAEVGATTSALASSSHTHPPFPYVETREAGVASLPVCEDTDGVVFRGHWQRGCTTLCAGGGEGCEEGRRACYWELPFSISQLDLEHGGQLARSGFANGNYNYRWHTVSANVVGTAVRDCEGSDSPSTCYGAGYVPYSIYHDGGFVVRNQWGELYEAPLFDGRLEHARALNAERFITNPLSSADRALIEPYTRYEMRGRPLAGRYRIRVWDQDGVRFDRIEDVQLVMAYRYWTRLN